MNKQFLYPISIAVVALTGLLLWNSQKNDKKSDLNHSSDPHDKLENENALSELSLWQDYSIASNPFSVKFPIYPQHVSEKGLDPKSKKVLGYDIYAAETLNGNIYGINIVTYPQQVSASSQSSVMARIIEDMIAQSPDNHLKFMNNEKFNDLDAYDFEIETPEKVIRGKTFFVGQSLYVLTAIYRKNQDNLQEYDHFIKSFRINQPSKLETTKVEK